MNLMTQFAQHIELLRFNTDEFTHLTNQIYLDHAANAIYMNSLIKDYSTKLINLNNEILFSNPHSHSQSGIYTKNFINSTREKLLKLFNTNSADYDVVFVQNSTHAFKLLGECFNFSQSHDDDNDDKDESYMMNQKIPSVFAYLNDNHTSVIGMRNIVSSSNITNPSVYSIHESNDENNDSIFNEFNQIKNGIWCHGFKNNNLFIYPAQSNFNGKKYSLNLIEYIHKNGIANLKSTGDWFVCLDTASYVSTSELDLSIYKPDFMVVSFYKIFGFPTGLGCLIIRKTNRVKNTLTNKKYFGGGTINTASIDSNVFYFKQSDSISDNYLFHEFLEDGTTSYLDVVALSVAIDKFNNLTLDQPFKIIRLYLEDLINILYKKLSELKHYNDVKLVEFYRKSNGVYGPILTFNLKDSKQNYISFNLVDKLAQQQRIHFRTGCFCNIGACQMFMKHLKENNNFYQKGHKCGDHIDLVDGLPTGAIRISLGYYSIRQDIDLFVKFLTEHFIDIDEQLNVNLNTQIKTKFQYFKITRMFIYPIKSCAPMRIKDSWEIKPSLDGFLYDRCWIIVDSNSIPLTQKRFPNLIKIKPFINLNTNILKLTFENDTFSLNLNSVGFKKDTNVYIYPNNIRGFDEGDEVNLWLKNKLNLNESCHLVRISSENSSFYNKESYLLINERSVTKLNLHTRLDNDEKLILQFRPNIVIQMLSENVLNNERIFEEEFWTRLNILNKNIEFKISDKCNRCQMININQSGKTSDNLNLLKDLYKLKSDSKFGVYLSQVGASQLNNQSRFKLDIGDIGTAYFKN